MHYRFLGNDRLKVSAIGYGCPPFQGKLSEADEKQAIAVLHRAIDIGVNFIDTADHNNGNNEEILAKALKGKRGEVVLTTKFGQLARPALGGRAGGRSQGRRSEFSQAHDTYSGSRPNTLISIICIASIQKFPSKIPLAQ
jgi:aryl-alcohol dehydrogenase-like predicted oxidoreductase